MNDNSFTPSARFCPTCLERIRNRQEDVHAWLTHYEVSRRLPLYSSVDIRDAGFKMAVVDTNLFPAGFNNLCEHGLADSEKFIKSAIHNRVPNGTDILIICEEHTRNTWYLENVRILQDIIRKAGFKVKIATFFEEPAPQECSAEHPFVTLTTATGSQVDIHCFKTILQKIEAGQERFDLIIMNNDLSTGIPEVLKNSKIPIYPSILAGWHSRSKSQHFAHTEDLIKQFAKIVQMDPWQFSCLFTTVDQVDINVDADRQKIADAVSDLFRQIQQKYREHHIDEKPYVVLKSDSGTYGMGVLTVEDPAEITQMNRRTKNKLYKGKSSQVIHRYILQEGVPTIYNIDNNVSEVVIYQIENNLIGGFYRVNTEKGQRENLNSRGMEFKKMCPHLKKYGDCGVHHDISIFDIYRILARIAALAADREIIQLEISQLEKPR